MSCSVSTPISLPWLALSEAKRLTPRGGPRPREVVVAIRAPRQGGSHGGRSLLMSGGLVPGSGWVSTGCVKAATLPSYARTALFAGRRQPRRRQWRGRGGVSDPPCSEPRSPRGRPGGRSRPLWPAGHRLDSGRIPPANAVRSQPRTAALFGRRATGIDVQPFTVTVFARRSHATD